MRPSRAPTQRQLRVGELLRHALAELFARGTLEGQLPNSSALTVIEVSVSPDLKQAKVYVMPLGGENCDDVLAVLERARKFLRGEVARRVELKFMPELKFEVDTTFDYSKSIDELLRDPHVAQDLEGTADGDA